MSGGAATRSARRSATPLGFAPYPVVTGGSEPLDCDEAAYGYIGRLLNRGSVLVSRRLREQAAAGLLALCPGRADRRGERDDPPTDADPVRPGHDRAGLVARAPKLRGPGAACLAAGSCSGSSAPTPTSTATGRIMEHFLNLFAVASLAAMVRSFSSRARPTLARPGRGAGRRWPAWSSRSRPCMGRSMPWGSSGWRGPSSTDRPMARRARSKVADLIALAAGFGASWTIAVAVPVGPGGGAFGVRRHRDLWLGPGDTIKVPEAQCPGEVDPLVHRQRRSRRGPPPAVRTDPIPGLVGDRDLADLAGLGPVHGLAPGGSRSRGGPSKLVAAWTLSCWVQVALARPVLGALLPAPDARPGGGRGGDDRPISGGGSSRRRRLGRPIRPSRLFLGSLAKVCPDRDRRVDGPAPGPRLPDGPARGVDQPATRGVGNGWSCGRWAATWGGGRRGASIARASTSGAGRAPCSSTRGSMRRPATSSPTPCSKITPGGFHRDDTRVRPRVERIMSDLEAHPPSMSLVAYPPFPELR